MNDQYHGDEPYMEAKERYYDELKFQELEDSYEGSQED